MSQILINMILFPNIFYFLIGLLSVFELDVAHLACIAKTDNLFNICLGSNDLYGFKF